MGTIANAKVTHYYNCYNGDFIGCLREEHQLLSASHLHETVAKRFPAAMRGMNANQFGKLLMAIGAERVHTAYGNVYKVVAI